MDSGEIIVSRKPSKQRRISHEHSTVTARYMFPPRQTPGRRKDHETTSSSDDILQSMLGVSPSSINLYRRQLPRVLLVVAGRPQQKEQRLQHALQCFHNLLDNLEHNNNNTTKSLDESQWRKVHGFTVLQLGNLDVAWNSEKETSDNSVQLEIVETICRCLKKIYHFAVAKNISTEDESQVVLDLLVQLLSCSCEAMTNHCSNDLQMEPRKTGFLTTILELIRVLIQCHNPAIKPVEELCGLLVRLLCDFDDSCHASVTTSSYKDNARAILDDLRQLKNQEIAYVVKLSNAAVVALQKQPCDSMDLHPYSSTQDHDMLLYWRCLVRCRRGATSLSRELNSLDRIVNMASSSTSSLSSNNTNHSTALNCMAAECLSLIAVHRDTRPCASSSTGESEPDWTMDALLRVLTNARGGLGVRKRTIPGLKCCKVNSIPWQDSTYLNHVLSSLSDIALAKHHDGHHSVQQGYKTDATAILIDIVETIISELHPEEQGILSFRQALSHVAKLVQVESDTGQLQLVINALDRETKRTGPRIVLQVPTLLNDLGKISCNPCAPLSLKRKTMDIFDTVTHEEEVLCILARQDKLLEALVVIASSPSPATDSDNNDDMQHLKRLALSVLMRLAQNVCNHRILAKHIGVLACMIRFARSLSGQQQEHQHQDQLRQTHQQTAELEVAKASEVRLDDLKQKIMDLASAM